MSGPTYDEQWDRKLILMKDRLTKQPCSRFFDIRVVGGLVKITPRGVPGKLLLELEQETIMLDEAEVYGDVCLYRHRSAELTERYKGRRIHTEWVLQFLAQPNR